MIRIIGLIIGVIFVIGGIIIGAVGTTVLLQEFETINESVATGIYTLIFGLAFLAIGNRIIKSIIKE